MRGTVYSFESDNFAPAHTQILEAVVACNDGPATPYGRDGLSERVNRVYSDIFEHEVSVFPAWTGTAANGLALGALTSGRGRILCHDWSHIFRSEEGAPTFFTGGATMAPLAGLDGKVDPGALQSALATMAVSGSELALSLSQSTESGTNYTPDELAALTGIAARAGVRTHMDGARFANAMVSLGASPADLTWKSGIDILSLGITKNGGMDCEAIIVFNSAIAARLAGRLKTAGAVLSKMRMASAQILAYVEDNLWIRNARAANTSAAKVSKAFSVTGDVTLVAPAEANQLFVRFEPDMLRHLQDKGFFFRPWRAKSENVYRLVTAFDQSDAEIELLTAAVMSERSATNS